ncbi:hypothetical protein E2I00_013749 [Balaenoptera physalus]|uniref:Cadherin domain-containing protein n=1 Tax=Balaenoptera physalus TaxID=9770 RepID=A0A643BVZ0_BALPH|nr:hypothetical protein E2I00_013749 [Balaenoptera physalus]
MNGIDIEEHRVNIGSHFYQFGTYGKLDPDPQQDGGDTKGISKPDIVLEGSFGRYIVVVLMNSNMDSLALKCRCYGTAQHSSIKGTRNQTKHIEGETEVHHRPKRGWVWNQFFVLEEHMGPDPQYVGKLHSNSDKGDGSVKYILTGEGAGTIFIIDDTTGDIHSTKSLDREQKTHYVLHAQAIDRRTNKPLEPESEFIIKVQDINDNAPKFTDGPYIVTVPEMSDMGIMKPKGIIAAKAGGLRNKPRRLSPHLGLEEKGTSVLQVTATDADDPTYGNSARVVYSILQGQPYFSVDPKTGAARYSKQAIGA